MRPTTDAVRILSMVFTKPTTPIFIALAAMLLASMSFARGASIQSGDVTAKLGPLFFVDDAVIGGSDVNVTQPATVSYARSFAGLISKGQGPALVTLNGFGFAAGGTVANNSATSLKVTFTYLGADEVIGGGDDVPMGDATASYAFSAASEYYFAFDTPLTAQLTLTGSRFRVQVAPTNAGGTGSVRFKSDALTYETASGPKFSVSGFVAPLRANLAKQQTAFASSVSGQRLASYLTDGITGNDNRWESAGDGPHWAKVVFPFPVEVGSAQVFSGVNDGGALTNFKIQYQNGATWVDVPGGEVAGNAGVETNIVFTSPVTSSSFRIYDSTDATMSVREFALYPPNDSAGFPLGTDLITNLAHLRPTLASANTAGNFARLATDGRVNFASKWQTTTLGAQWLEIDLRVSTKIGSALLYSGSLGVAPLSNFTLRYWDGAAWQAVPGGSVSGNTSAARAVGFTGAVTTNKVRLEFTNPGTTSVQELCIFPANGGGNYPIGASVIGAPPVAAEYDEYRDAYHRIVSPAAANRFLVVENGVPRLSSAGTATALGQYQILLNVGAGTYRLRNRDTGLCLSGARLSTATGAALLDAPYSALPDQDWLLDAIDGTSFFLVNQWSGLVLDTQGGSTAAGTALVQNPNTGAATQRWQLVYDTHHPKKGIGGTNFAVPFKAQWLYAWGLKTSATFPDGVLFNPMQWGDFNWNATVTQNSMWKLISGWRANGDALHLMGFNEPDRPDQANMALTDCVTCWPRLLSAEMPLVAPCPADLLGGWMASFYAQTDALGYRIDYTPKHTYRDPQGGSSDALVSELETAYTTWGRPMWLTEFSFVNWSGTGTWTEEDSYNCLAEFLWRAESIPWLRKYALFVFTEDAGSPNAAQPWDAVGPRSNSYDDMGKMTAFGELYAAWDGVAAVVADKPYFIHNKDTRKRMSNGLGAGPGGRSIRVSDGSVAWTLTSTGSAGKYYVTSLRDNRRLSYVNGGAVSFAAAGATGAAVEWQLSETEYGWFFLVHPATSKRLQLAYNNSTSVATYTMAASTTTNDSVQWRFVVPMPTRTWTGATNATWTTAGNWIPNGVPGTSDAVIFNSLSIANLSTTLGADFTVDGLAVTVPTANVSIAGTGTLTLGARGIDLSAASKNLTLAAPLALGAAQTWRAASGRILAVNGGISGEVGLTISGAGKVTLGAAALLGGDTTIEAGGTLQATAPSVLPSGAGRGDLVVDGTLNLNGFSQSMNGLWGSGAVDNTAAGACTLTVGAGNATSTFAGTLKNTSGALALVMTGSGDLTLAGNNTHAGGTTLSGSGSLYPKTDAAFGTGPVVLNDGVLYGVGDVFTFPNALTLNGGWLRVGGGAGRSITWTGPVSVTADSAIMADGSTSGITISGSLNIAGFTLTSDGSVTNTISGALGGTGRIFVAGGTLELAAANTFAGTARATAGTLRVAHALALQNATLDMNGADSGSVSLNNLNASLGALTGSRNLGLGSGTVSIGGNGASTTYSGALSGTGSLVKTGSGTLTLTGANSYSGTTTVSSGTLLLGAVNVLPSTGISLGNSTLQANAAESTGGLDVTGAARIHLGTGATLAFTTSSGVNWNGGTLLVTGSFVSGSSLRFGPTSGGLTSAQLSQITVSGYTNLALNSSGFLTATPTGATLFNGWSGGTAFDADTNGDGVANGIAWLLGAGNPSANARALMPVFDNTDPTYFIFTYRRADVAFTASGVTIAVQYATVPGTWTNAVHDGANVIITVTNDIAPGVDAVQVKFKRALAPAGRFFTRLRAEIAP